MAYLAVAVTTVAGGLNGYLAFAGHDEVASVAHVLGGAASIHDHDHPHASATARTVGADVHDHAGCVADDCDGSDHAGHSWQHVHAHCCGAPALIPGNLGVTRFGISRDVEFALKATLPSGNLSFPLLRPPRMLG